MGFDIYGQHLRHGYCEVHPNVAEPYPCSVCMADVDRKARERREQRDYKRTMEEAYYKSLMGYEEYKSWAKP